MRHLIDAWKEWWDGLGHVARCNRDEARIREAFEAGYMAALARTRVPAASDAAVKSRGMQPEQRETSDFGSRGQ